MKKTENKNSKSLKTGLKAYFEKTLLTLAAAMCCYSSMAQNASGTITISGSKFANPLIEKWADEYAKSNPGVTFKFVKGTGQVPSDLALTVNAGNPDDKSGDNQITVGRLAVLPVANEKNSLFDKQLKNGISQEELKGIFLHLDSAQYDSENNPKAEPTYTVYTQTPQSATAQVLINHFGQTDSELNGTIVTGDDKYLIESVLGDPAGVTYSNLSLIYDLNKRVPLSGIKILPIDPDNSGHLKKDELVYDNLDQLITYLETSKIKTIPSDEISLSYNKNNNNPLVADFVNWVKISGQQFNHQFGFLRTNDKESALTQK